MEVPCHSKGCVKDEGAVRFNCLRQEIVRPFRGDAFGTHTSLNCSDCAKCQDSLIFRDSMQKKCRFEAHPRTATLRVWEFPSHIREGVHSCLRAPPHLKRD